MANDESNARIDPYVIPPGEFQTMLDTAAKRGAAEALHSIGLDDEAAVHDVHELRSLLSGWRDIKSSVTKTIAKAITMFILGAIAAVLYFRH